jgi:hypothetical protein
MGALLLVAQWPDGAQQWSESAYSGSRSRAPDVTRALFEIKFTTVHQRTLRRRHGEWAVMRGE